MRRDLIGYLFAALAFLALLTVALPAIAARLFTPEELMGEREIKAPVCVDGTCTMAEDDLQFIVQRGRLMEALANRLYERVKSCNGGRDV